MNTTEERPGFFKTIINDLLQFISDLFNGNLLRNFKKDLRDVKEFFIEEERKRRLTNMNRFRRFFYVLFWLLQALIFKLTSFRRILLLFGILLLLGARNGGPAGANNQILLGGLVFLFVLLLELKDKLTAHTELEAGRSVQKALAPETHPDISGWDIWLFTRSANQVGGDLVDYIPVDIRRNALVIGDVAGKGLAAALHMAKLQAILRALAPDYESLPLLFQRLNRILYRDSMANSFASLLCAELTPDVSEVRLVNAGHMPPILLTKSGITEMDKGDPALGLIPSTEYRSVTVKLSANDVLFIYSDGVTESINTDRDFFGEDRLKRKLSESKEKNAAEIGKAILDEVDQFADEAPAMDDLSMLVIKKR